MEFPNTIVLTDRSAVEAFVDKIFQAGYIEGKKADKDIDPLITWEQATKYFPAYAATYWRDSYMSGKFTAPKKRGAGGGKITFYLSEAKAFLEGQS